MMDETRLVVQLAIGLVFLLSTSGKLLNPVGFARGVADYRILPDSLAFALGLLLVPSEAFLAVSHLSGWQLSLAAPLGLALLASFGVAVAVNLKRGRALPCYCFGGQGGETISGHTLARLLLLFAGELLVFFDPSRTGTGQLTYPFRVTSFAQLGLAIFWATFLLVVVTWLLGLQDVLALLRRCANCGARAGRAGSNSAQNPSEGTS